MTLIGRGYQSRIEDVEKTHDDKPTQNVITRVTGPGQFDAYCMIMIIQLLFFFLFLLI